MDFSALYIVLSIIAVVIGCVLIAAIYRLFSIDWTLKQIRNELLIQRQERQANHQTASS